MDGHPRIDLNVIFGGMLLSLKPLIIRFALQYRVFKLQGCFPVILSSRNKSLQKHSHVTEFLLLAYTYTG